MEIRKMQKSDIDSIAEITLHAWSDNSPRKLLEERYGVIGNMPWREKKSEEVRAFCLEKPSDVIVALVDDTVAGYATFSIDRENSVGHVLNNAVSLAFQHRGIGTAMNKWIIEYFREQRLEVARVSTVVSNIAAQKIYEKQGFEELGRTIHYAMSL